MSGWAVGSNNNNFFAFIARKKSDLLLKSVSCRIYPSQDTIMLKIISDACGIINLYSNFFLVGKAVTPFALLFSILLML